MQSLEYVKTNAKAARFLCGALMFLLAGSRAEEPGANLALVATSSTSFVSGHETIGALNDGFTPGNSDDKSHGAYGNWPRNGTQWVQYEWSKPICTRKMDVYWFDDSRGVRVPKACRLLFWDGSNFVPVPSVNGLGLEKDKFNTTTFSETTTAKLRLEMDGADEFSTGILEWRVYDSGSSPNFPPTVEAGPDRVVVMPGRTWLDGTVKDDGKVKSPPALRWTKKAGPGKVTFADATSASTSARFSRPGAYVLELAADDGQNTASAVVNVSVEPPAPRTHLDFVWPARYSVGGPFWQPRVKNLIVHWIPHCIAKISDPKLPEGGIENFIEAGNKLAGRPAKHTGAPFANAWVYNTIESICLAQMVDPQEDREIAQAQEAMRQTLEDWIPKILAAQEPDGYLHTMYTISGHKRWTNKADHEGYNGGYFIEAGIAHYLMTDGKDRRLFDAARRLADCWVANIGPAPKRSWYEGHEEIEQALARLARFTDRVEGPGKGEKYLELSKFLLDARRNGEEYDQTHVPVTRQYEAVGHAVRAAYCYSGMADIAMETGDVDYESAVKSLWSSIVNRKYYITGGIGSGETSEGFGKDYSLPNNAYCESCADCGELFFQHKLQLSYGEAQYADLYEETLYNAIAGSVDLEGQNFTYTNPLDSNRPRYKWHGCPCCVGNIPRTILMLPSWTYSTGKEALYVNLYSGIDTRVQVGGTSVQLTQRTEYPWHGKVDITLSPAEPKRFSLKLRVPQRNVSTLYSASPGCDGIASLSVNGVPVKATVDQGYVSISRKWKPGDKVEAVFPMQAQRVHAKDQIAALKGRVALRYGPLVYNIESADQAVESVLKPDSPLKVEWNASLLGGVMVIKGAFADGQPMLAIPNYARLNRGGRSIVWVREE